MFAPKGVGDFRVLLGRGAFKRSSILVGKQLSEREKSDELFVAYGAVAELTMEQRPLSY